MLRLFIMIAVLYQVASLIANSHHPQNIEEIDEARVVTLREPVLERDSLIVQSNP